ncbi:MAG: hypothetical protein AABY07_10250 [Nanoarchaeota archaeon]
MHKHNWRLIFHGAFTDTYQCTQCFLTESEYGILPTYTLKIKPNLQRLSRTINDVRKTY